MKAPVRAPATPQQVRCAIYTRVSTEHGLEQAFNSLHSQREAAEAYVKSQAHEGWRLLPERYDDGGFSGGSLERPALTRLLAEVVAGRVEVIVVYKVDRLTRALSDFAKLVELFDRHGVSFVSVTQAFNTTTSMGRLTLNVLLSFAQFERELTGERIRDKIAASKRKGIWMGGIVPLGYRVEARALHVVPEDAALVRRIFERYRALGSVGALAAELEREGAHAPDRRSVTGGRVRGGPFSRGHLYKLLAARVYLGEITHRGASHPGRHAAIIELELFAAVAEQLAAQTPQRRRTRSASGALLGRRLFDADGNAMTPSHTRKGGVLYRYYVSQALLRGRARQRGAASTDFSPGRVPAAALEEAVLAALGGAVRRRTPAGTAIEQSIGATATAALYHDDRPRSEAMMPALVERWLERVVVRTDALVITLRADAASADGDGADAQADEIVVPWSSQRRSSRAAVLAPEARAAHPSRARQPMPEDVRRQLLVSIARARAWTEALASGRATDTAMLAARAGCSERHVRMLLPLAALAPDIVEAAIEGRLAAGYGAARLCRGLSAVWAEQRKLIPIISVPQE
ncbi:DNA invertase Pin-like site-specific DNA recombinase [Methylobacterium brachiatum]|uniref:DNA invertase Pin-like site-specific DNA recombinase n=1 Tax=Methylobacterium brachiatum TaxID=269660 RepID=A0AAJ1TSP4_9HYPH|nr:recombinase family protein [Methylobacterium brachiatum]MCB4803397.1 recombinase family protein [Methylobacterium brachiatum]MDQ0544129.1 DNA invertase Pin-like site-specific DNA recombinase [Methylobacterium brachiatum]